MLQKLPDYVHIADQDAWDRLTQLANTLRADELAQTDNQTMTLRLFHEEEVSILDSERVQFACSCSEERSSASIQALGQEEALDILECEPVISVDCQFCGQHYEFDRKKIQALFGLSDLQ